MILVVGSTGYLGGTVTRSLAGAGKPVAALVRDASSEKARALEAAGAKLVRGDLKDRATVEKALEGVDTVICTASSTLSRREGDSLETVDGRGVQSLIEAAETKGARRFIFVSFSRNIAGDFPLATFKRAAEKRLESSKLLQLEYMTVDQIEAARAAASDSMQASFLGLFDALAHGDVVATDWTRTLGVQPASLEDWVARTFGAGG